MKDNVVTVFDSCKIGDKVSINYEGKVIYYQCNSDIPFGHKLAIIDIKKGDKIVKYGEVLGFASEDIKKGDWVHTHNVKDDYKIIDFMNKVSNDS
jgi:altronate dehydratase small subunit